MTDTNHHVLTGKVDITSNLLVGSSHLFVDTNNNRVGLITTNPDAGLHVNSNAYVNTDLRVGPAGVNQVVINATAGRIKAGSFEGDGSLLENVPAGADGAAATIAVGTTTPGPVGTTTASVTNSGTSSAAVFDFVIPRGDAGTNGTNGDDGDDGAAATIGNPTITTGLAGTEASVTNSGTSSAAVFDFVIPRGDRGTDGTNYFTLSGSNIYRNTGNVGIGVTDPGISKLYVQQDDTTAAGGTTGVTIGVNLSGSDATAGDPVYRGLFVDMDSTATGGNTGDEHRMYGIFCDVRHSGDSDLVYSGYFYARSDHSAGTNSSLKGVYSSAVDSAGGTNSSIIAGEFKALKDGGSGNTTATMMGVRAEVEIDAGTITNAYGVYSQIDRDGGTVNTSYLFYGVYSGSDTGTRRGIWIEGVYQNYISGNLGIDKTAPETALHVNGSITVGDIGANNVSHTDAQLILGGTHNQGYNRNNYIKLLISGGNNDGGSPYYILCEDENSYDQFYVKGSTSSGGSGRMWVRGEVKMASAGDTYALVPGNDGWLRLQGSASGQGNMYSGYTSLALGNFYAAGSTRFSSDDRVKHFEEQVPALDLIRQLKPYKYKKTSKIYTEDYTGEIGEEGKDWEWEIGLIAQDIEKIPYLEFAVSKPEDSPEDKYGLNYTQFIGVCIQGIKKLDEDLQTTKEELQSEKNKVATMELLVASLVKRVGDLENLVI